MREYSPIKVKETVDLTDVRLLDIHAPEHVEVVFDASNRLYVHVNGVTVLRIYALKDIKFIDELGVSTPYLSLDAGTLYEELTPQATKTIINAAMREIGSMEGGITVSAEERQYLRDIYVWLMRASVAIEQEINTQTVEAEREVVQGFGFDVGEPR